jgi:glucose/arabinose dehydrogenase
MRRVIITAAVVVLIAPLALFAQGARPVSCDPGNGGLTLPAGFCALVVAETVGAARHLVVAPNGDIYVAIRNQPDVPGGIVALRDTNGDGRADVRERFADPGGTGIALYNGYLYLSRDEAVVRFP